MARHDVCSVSLHFLVTQRSLLFKIHLSNCKRNILHLICIVEQDRRVTKNFFLEGEGETQIRTQILNSSVKLNYMETTQCASFKNSYLCQIQIIFQFFLIKRILGGFSIFSRKNKKVFFIFLYHIP